MRDIVQIVSENQMWLSGVLLLFIALLLIWLVRKRSSQDELSKLLDAIGVDHLSNIVVDDDLGGEIHIEHLLLTGRGLVILDVKTIRGSIFSSDRMDEWTVISPQDRSTIQNPQRSLYYRISALRSLVQDVPVTGHILFLGAPEFAKGRPMDVIFPDELLDRYEKPGKIALESIVDAFFPYWERVRNACKQASDGDF
ncbi:MAG: nuclease-related domain-containing protein [Pseudomonadota bacterium]|nr:nuclease-related domain-containing protein [Pseudomonadota bacterium]